MSLETEIAALVAANNKMVDYFNGKKAAIDAAVSAAVAAAPSIVRAYWVDPQLGDDSAIGTEASPFKTLQRAVDATPDGGRVTAWLARDYVLDKSITTSGRQLVIAAVAGSGRKLICNEFMPEGSDQLTRMGSFWLSNGSTLQLLNVTVSLPASSAGDLSAYYALAFASGSSAPILMQVRMYNCTLELRGTFRGKLIGPGSALIALSMTGTAVPSALNGSLFVGIAAGTLSKDLGHIITNLSSL
ncbi:hypothetical protein [Pseudomonas monteilii]|uniref:hypothetical protein n=1 Tax=Pseudomonas monteilii TaxID=76759 RepID=UPI00048C1D1C|nr:hypothetical protein [Pseudomonas monteilii]KPM60189.1 hypothetical protein HB4184_22025 [Pseudomonas putida]MBA6089180.1 hypothetical protein [Pseudomonas monteilii]MCE1021639.1 hypothetical protein [Pseudomonas monteilii]